MLAAEKLKLVHPQRPLSLGKRKKTATWSIAWAGSRCRGHAFFTSVGVKYGYNIRVVVARATSHGR
jgi:hypothetical protein